MSRTLVIGSSQYTFKEEIESIGKHIKHLLVKLAFTGQLHFVRQACKGTVTGLQIKIENQFSDDWKQRIQTMYENVDVSKLDTIIPCEPSRVNINTFDTVILLPSNIMSTHITFLQTIRDADLYNLKRTFIIFNKNNILKHVVDMTRHYNIHVCEHVKDIIKLIK